MASKKTNDIVTELQIKATLKSQIMKVAKNSFEELYSTLEGMKEEYNSVLTSNAAQNAILTKELKVELTRPSQHVYQINADEDTLILSLQNGVYQFDRDHEVWQTPYVQENEARSYAAIVNIYNFLSDSFKYDRCEDPGYLVARVFISAEGTFFVEGKRQRGMGSKDYGKKPLNGENWKKIIETALKYCIDFDMLVPPYENVMLTDLGHMYLEIQSSKTKTGKRLGFQFRSDDVRDN